jgi:serine protease Do
LRGQGSGVIIDPEGYIVTNYHVVLGAREIQVSLSDGRVVSARIVGVDTLTDLAVLKIDSDKLIAAEWGNSDDLRVGALVWAVGSPFGLERTITFGILSAKHRSGMAGEVYQDFLQTDAAVNPGNSGGPLVDAHGRVIGINTAILGDSYQGVSFAIPSSVAKNVYQRLKTSGQVARGWLGVQLREVDEEDILRYGLSDMKGAFVARVVDEPDVPCPARDAGIQVRDVVIDWNGTPITKPAELIRLVAMTDAGTTATVVVLRGGRRISLQVLVAKRPAFLDS